MSCELTDVAIEGIDACIRNGVVCVNQCPLIKAGRLQSEDAAVQFDIPHGPLPGSHLVAHGRALWKLIGIGGHLAVPPLPHHRAYGSVPRRFGRLKGQDRSRYGNPSESK